MYVLAYMGELSSVVYGSSNDQLFLDHHRVDAATTNNVLTGFVVSTNTSANYTGIFHSFPDDNATYIGIGSIADR